MTEHFELNAVTAATTEGARLYALGRFDEAVNIFTSAAESGEPEALMWLGACHANGDGLPSSLNKAFELYLRAAEAGHAQAQTNVGAMLMGGQGCDKDVDQAIIWLGRAADQGDIGAQFNLATILSAGKDVEPEYERAIDLYRKAAESGHYPSQARLGFAYQQGRGVAKSRVEAYVWLALAAQHGVGSALSALERVIGEMSAEEKRDGAGRLNEWRHRSQPSPSEPSLKILSH
jgi:uncharacterized protein